MTNENEPDLECEVGGDLVDYINQSIVEEIHANYCNIFENGIFNIEFKKADGSLRKMRCTRDSNFIPNDLNELTKVVVLKEGQKPRKVCYTTLRVYELDKGWRSFKIENLISNKRE